MKITIEISSLFLAQASARMEKSEGRVLYDALVGMAMDEATTNPPHTGPPRRETLIVDGRRIGTYTVES